MALKDSRCEQTPLIPGIAGRQARVPSSHALPRTEQPQRQKLSAYSVIPVLFFTRFVAAITITSKIQVIRDVACAWWLNAYDPASLPAGGVYPPQELCHSAGVEQAFSFIISTLAIIDAFGGIVSSGIVSRSAARYGRRPVILSLTLLIAISTMCFIAAMSVHGALRNVLLLAWILIGAICGPVVFSLACSMYVVDTTEQHRRTFVFNVADGLAVLGTAPTYWLGGYLSRQSNIVTVFWWKLLAIVLIILYTLALVPESFSSENQPAPLQSESPHEPRQTGTVSAVLQRPLDTVTSIFAPLKLLRPFQDSISGQADSRLRIVALSQFMNTLGSEYVGNAFVSYASRLQIDSDHLAVALGGFAVSQVIWLSVVVPALIRWVRPFHNKHRPSAPSQEEIEAQTGDTTRVTAFDVYLACTSSILGALASMFIGLAPSSPTVIVAFIMTSLGTGHDPTTRSIVTSIDLQHSDQALSALTIVSSMGALLAPLIFGYIPSSVIPKFPQVVFFLSAATIALGGLLLLLARGYVQDIKSATAQDPE